MTSIFIVHVGSLMICDGWYNIFNLTSCVFPISEPWKRKR